MKEEIERRKALETFPAFPCVMVTCQENIITIGMVHIFSFSPPLVGIGVHPSRFSFQLLKSAKEYVINIPTKELLKAVNFCGEKSGREFDKFSTTGLTKEKSLRLKTPAILECPINIECRVIKEIEIGDHTWFIGEVKACRVKKEIKPEELLLYWARKYWTLGEKIEER